MLRTASPVAGCWRGCKVGMAAVWGGSWPAGRVPAQAQPPLAVASWRFGVALVLLLVWLHGTAGLRRLCGLTTQQWGGLALAGAVGVFGYAVFFMLGLARVPAGRAALVVTANPVATTLLAAWWFGEWLNLRIGAGMALATAGASVVITQGKRWALLTGGLGVGELLLLGCAASWVAYTLMGRRLLQGIDALATTAVTAGLGLVLLMASGLAFEGPQALAAPLRAGSAIWVAWQGQPSWPMPGISRGSQRWAPGRPRPTSLWSRSSACCSPPSGWMSGSMGRWPSAAWPS